MSSSSNSNTRREQRRRWLIAALAAVFAPSAMSTVQAADSRPVAAAPGNTALAGLRPWGGGDFRRFGLLIYQARLWIDAPPADRPSPPYALEITYRRTIRGEKLADASLDEMRKQGLRDPVREAAWLARLRTLFPDVVPGDRIVGLHLPGTARFFHNDRPLGQIDDPALADAFFAIWLDPRTSAPDLRAALLRAPEEG